MSSTPNRLLRSCETCRVAKSKCFPDADDPAKPCQRCARLNKDCVFIEAQRRAKRQRSSKTRDAEFEKKINDIYDILQNGITSSSSHSTGAVAEVTETTPQTPYFAAPSAIGAMATSSIVQPSNIFPTNPLPDVIETGLLTSEEAMELLHAYRTNSVNFPFVPLRDNFDLSHIRRYRPVLFIGALTMACQQNKRRQLALDLAFREVLSRKVIMEGQRNLDLLEGLMVYLSGYYFYFNPFNQQLYQLVQLIVAMAADLGIDKPSNSHTADNIYGHAQPGGQSDIDMKRTAVGCYYLSSCLSLIFRRRTGMPASKYIEACCLDLAMAQVLPSDRDLIHLFRIQRLVDRASRVHDIEDLESMTEREIERFHLSARALQSDLAAIKSSIDDETLSKPPTQISLLFAAIVILEISMHIESTISHPDFSPSASPTSAKTNETLLIECFQASLTCLHYISHLSPSQYAMCSMADQSKFCYCLIIVLKLGLYLDYGRLHRLQISESLLRLCEIDKKLTNTPVEKTEASVLLDTYSHSLRILQNANTWFLETTREENGYGRNWGELNDISPFQLLEKKPVDQNLSMGQQNHMPLDILDRSWDDLAMEWLMPVDGQLLG